MRSRLPRVVAITPDTVRRLALIRLLLGRAEEESRQSAPFAADSINRLHDVAEMFLALAAEVRQADVRGQEFMSYWPALSQTLDSPLTYRLAMQKVNKARVALKHHGIEPAAQTIERCRTAVRGLVQDECPRLFGVEIEEVGLAEFIGSPVARGLVDAAESKWKMQDDPLAVSEAFADLAEAFDELIQDYAGRKRTAGGRSVFQAIDELPNLRESVQKLRASHFSSDKSALTVLRALEPFERRIVESLTSMEALTMVIGLGVDMRRYGRFRLLTPEVSRTASGGRHYVDRDSDPARTEEHFHFCRDFVISAALHLAEYDYDRDLRKAWLPGPNTVTIHRGPRLLITPRPETAIQENRQAEAGGQTE